MDEQSLIKSIDNFLNKENTQKDKYGGRQTHYHKIGDGSSVERQVERGIQDDGEQFDMRSFIGGKGAAQKPRRWELRGNTLTQKSELEKGKTWDAIENYGRSLMWLPQKGQSTPSMNDKGAASYKKPVERTPIDPTRAPPKDLNRKKLKNKKGQYRKRNFIDQILWRSEDTQTLIKSIDSFVSK